MSKDNDIKVNRDKTHSSWPLPLTDSISFRPTLAWVVDSSIILGWQQGF